MKLFKFVAGIAVLAGILSMNSIEPAQARIPGTSTVHSKIYPIRISLTDRAPLTDEEYNSVLADMREATSWWSSQTDKHITFDIVDSSPCGGSITRDINDPGIQIRDVKMLAHECGIPDDVLDIPVGIFKKSTKEACNGNTAQSHMPIATFARLTSPLYEDRENSSPIVLLPSSTDAR